MEVGWQMWRLLSTCVDRSCSHWVPIKRCYESSSTWKKKKLLWAVSTKRRLPGESLCLTKPKRSKLHQKLILSEMGGAGGEGLIAWDRATVSHGKNRQLPKLVGWGRERGGWGGSYPKKERGWRSEGTRFIFPCLPSVQYRRVSRCVSFQLVYGSEKIMHLKGWLGHLEGSKKSPLGRIPKKEVCPFFFPSVLPRSKPTISNP